MSLIITSDCEPFTVSDCLCDFCMSYNKINTKWLKNKPKSNLQKRMQKVIYKIEKKYGNRKFSEVGVPKNKFNLKK